MSTRRKRLEYTDTEKIAQEFLEKYHPSGTLPVPVERIVEVDLEIQIVPIPGLSAVLRSQEGALVRDRTEIIVDSAQVDAYDRNQNPRYLFTLAHELGHYVLHEEYYAAAKFTSTEEYKTWYMTADASEIDGMEVEANNFAGQILLPGPQLVEACTEIIEEYAVMLSGIDEEFIWAYAQRKVAKRFGVSELCTHHRIRLARRNGPLRDVRW
jgi:hypothetical protein